MTELPLRPDILDSNISTGVWKTYYGNIRDFISQMPGGASIDRPIIFNKTISPKYCFNAIETEGNSTSGEITHIQTTNIPDGQVIFITALNSDISITLKHNVGGVGSIYLFLDKDVVLTDKFTLILIREGNNWRQINTIGYIFNELGIVQTGLLPIATNQQLGLSRFATDTEFSKGYDLLATTPKQVKTLEVRMDEMIYPVTIYQNMKQITNDGVIELEDNIGCYTKNVTSHMTLSIDTSNVDTSKKMTFEIMLSFSNTSYSINFPSNITWLNGVAPDMSQPQNYSLAFTSYNGGGLWVGNLQGYW